MTKTEICVQILTAFLGSLGFSILFNVRASRLLVAGFGGALSWGVYLLLGPVISNDSIKYFIASLFVTIYAEVFARILKSPTTSFLVPSFIPLIPGGALYSTMKYALHNDWTLFANKAAYTMRLALALTAGIVTISSVMRIINEIGHLHSKGKCPKK